MKKEPKTYLTHILQSIERIERYLKNVSKEEFLQSEALQDQVTRRLEVIGEAVKQMPDDFKDQYSHIPWRDIGDMRNILIHVYFDVDYEIVWETATKLTQELKEQIKKIINS